MLKGPCFLMALPHRHQSAQVGACTSRALDRSPGPLCNSFEVDPWMDLWFHNTDGHTPAAHQAKRG